MSIKIQVLPCWVYTLIHIYGVYFKSTSAHATSPNVLIRFENKCQQKMYQEVRKKKLLRNVLHLHLMMILTGVIQPKKQMHYSKPRHLTPAVSGEKKSDDASSNHSTFYLQNQSIRRLFFDVAASLRLARIEWVIYGQFSASIFWE